MAIERQDEVGGDNQYLLRVVTKAKDGSYTLRANNPAYEDLQATDEMRTLARLKAVVEPLALVVGQPFIARTSLRCSASPSMLAIGTPVMSC